MTLLHFFFIFLVSAEGLTTGVFATTTQTSGKKLSAQNYQAHAQLKKAAEQFEKLYQRSVGGAQEETILLKLIDTYQKIIAIENSFPNKVTSTYSSKLITSTTNYISKFPNGNFVSAAITIRAKHFRDSGRIELAKKDFDSVIKSNKASIQQKVVSLVFLSDILMQEQRYAEAIPYLVKLESAQENTNDKEHLKTATEQLSIAHAKLNQLEKALFYAEKFWSLHSKPSPSEIKSAISNITYIYSQLNKKGIPQFSVQNSIPYFTRVFGNQLLPTAFHEFAYQLRTSDQNQSVAELAFTLLKNNSGLNPSAIYRVIEVYLDSSFASKKYPQVEQFLTQILEASNSLGPEQAFRSFVLSLADAYQKGRLTKGTDRDKLFINTIKLLYKIAIQATGKDQIINGKVYLNLAEISFENSDFPLAEISYNKAYELLSHSSENPSDNSPNNIQNDLKKAFFFSLLARYEILKRNKEIPHKLDVKLISSIESNSSLSPDHPLHVWNSKIDTFIKTYVGKLTAIELEKTLALKHEANRALYQFHDASYGTFSFQQFVNQYPQSSYAESASAIVLETLVKSNLTKEAQEVANTWTKDSKLSNSPSLKNIKLAQAEFISKNISALFQASKFQEALSSFQKILEENPQFKLSPLFVSTSLIAAYAALKIQKTSQAESLFVDSLKSNKISAQQKLQALNGLVQLYENAGLLEKSIPLYTQIIVLDPKSKVQNKTRLLTIALYTSNQTLERLLLEPSICSKSEYKNTNDPCSTFLAFYAALSGTLKSSLNPELKKRNETLLSKYNTIPVSNLKTALSIQKLKSLSYSKYTKNNYTQTLKAKTYFIDEITKNLPKTNASLIPLVLAELDRYLLSQSTIPLQQINKLFPLTLNPKQIELRKKANEAYEYTQAKLSAWPFIHAKIIANKNISISKFLMANSLKSMPLPPQFSKQEADETKKLLLSNATPLAQEAIQIANITIKDARRFSTSYTIYSELVKTMNILSPKEIVPEASPVQPITLYKHIQISKDESFQKKWEQSIESKNYRAVFLMAFVPNSHSLNSFASEIILSAGYSILNLNSEANQLLLKSLNSASSKASNSHSLNEISNIIIASHYLNSGQTEKWNALDVKNLSNKPEFSEYFENIKMTSRGLASPDRTIEEGESNEN